MEGETKRVLASRLVDHLENGSEFPSHWIEPDEDPLAVSLKSAPVGRVLDELDPNTEIEERPGWGDDANVEAEFDVLPDHEWETVRALVREEVDDTDRVEELTADVYLSRVEPGALVWAMELQGRDPFTPPRFPEDWPETSPAVERVVRRLHE